MNCSPTWECRRSDALLVRSTASANDLHFGYMANLATPDPDSSWIIRYSPDIRITDWYRLVFVDPFVGMELAKIGEHTGWVYGEVTGVNAVVGYYFDGRRVMFTHSVRTDLSVKDGDSGSPVYRHIPGVPWDTSTVILYGIMFAVGGQGTYFSHWYGIQYDMGFSLAPK